VNTDFFINGYQYLNLSVFDINTGKKVATKEKIQAGSSIQMPNIASGIYIFMFSTPDEKITKQFKIVKL
jgi:hypothetical protein